MVIGIRTRFSSAPGAVSLAALSALVYNRHALELDRDRRRQCGDAQGRAAGLGRREVFGVEAVVGREVARHVGQVDGHVDEVFPARAGGFEHGAHVGEDLAALRFAACSNG